MLINMMPMETEILFGQPDKLITVSLCLPAAFGSNHKTFGPNLVGNFYSEEVWSHHIRDQEQTIH
jgi:hypothetical protein